MATIGRRAYAEMFGPTKGDRVRLADTDLVIEVEDDYTLRAGGYGEEVKFGGGKTIRDGMAQSQRSRAEGAVDTVLTNALIIDHWGIVKADIGLKDGRITAIGKAGNPDTQPGVDIIIGPGTEIIACEGSIVTAGGIDTHIHFICPQQIEEALASGITTMFGGGTGPATGTFATTCTPGPWHMERMLQAADAFPMNLGFMGKGNASQPQALREQIDAGMPNEGLRHGESLRFGLAQVMIVQVVELVPVQAGRGPDHVADVEPGRSLGVRENLVVTMPPPQLGQVVAQGLGQVAHVVKFADRLGAVALGQFLAVWTMDHGQMSPDRRFPSHGLIDVRLPGGVVQVVVAPDDVGHPHVVVIDHDGEVVGGRPVGPQQDQVVQVHVLEDHLALDLVVDPRGSLLGRTQADHVGPPGVDRPLRVAPGGADHPAFSPGALALLGQFVGGHEVPVGTPPGQEVQRHFAVAVGAAELEDRRLVRLQAQPGKAVEDHLHGCVRGPLPVGIFDAQQILSTCPSGVEPVEQGGAGGPDVHGPGGRGRDARDDLTFAHGSSGTDD